MALLDWLWCQPQTLIGWCFTKVWQLIECRSRRWRDAHVLIVPNGRWGVSLGPYILLSEVLDEERYVRHEYGHTVQSRILGPLYLMVIGVPSVCLKLASAFSESVRDEYFSYWPESWADTLGGVGK